MISNVHKTKIEYGDFQTPLELAERICQKLLEMGVNPDVIVEPTCGLGNFIEAAANSFPSTDKIFGIEINPNYLQEFKSKERLLKDSRIDIQQGDFFQFDWLSLVNKLSGNILVLGNFPWVTNSQQGSIGGNNLPDKYNFQNHTGLDAMTGKSNFDISEWMLIQVIQCLQKRDTYLAMLCKASVARKVLNYIYSHKLNLAYCATYNIDAKKYFDANVEACLLFCRFDLNSQNYYCDVFSGIDSSKFHRIGYRNDILIRDIAAFDNLNKLYDNKSKTKWRSGVKHDCSKVMELRKADNIFINGFGEAVDIEETYLFPLMKGSDIAQNRTHTTDRYIIVTQKFVGQPTEYVKDLAPKTWNYLESHTEHLDKRKSKIYHNNPRFSVFGVGLYTFTSWKIAICGLYKKLDFRLVGKIANKPVVFDDTVYFLSFDDEVVADKNFEMLTSPTAIEFYSSLIFWDEKRPIKSSILNSLNLQVLADINSRNKIVMVD
ncbi:class I SAM-dependent methyltransferase [Calothrix sp. PCC 7507]|uniref:class I SAM-dependent methyltransferase n=1 Tax=Calothrix sp. PCC 7507 TaxID=99598 RepID=UPI00029EEA3F|nr:class I SAM-dependent methyltransferase [Calothrix sp. PCC 7507]AFY32445.1 type II restriction enzyme NspV-like protein [Calothrix sp. PCC 7507]